MATGALIYFGLTIAAAGLFAHGLRLAVLGARIDRRLVSSALDSNPERASRTILPAGLKLTGGKDRAEIEAKLRNAGFVDPLAVEIFVLARIAATLVAFLAVGLASARLADGFFALPLLMIIVPGLVYIGMKLGLGILAAGRVRRITAEFPFLLDLMYMMLQSGISLDQCLRTIAAENSPAIPHLSREFGALVADLDRGLSYDVALDRWAGRLPIAGARELAALFRQSLFHGIELIPALREFGREFSLRRLAAAKEAMGSITVRMVILMIVFFMPALFIVLGGPPVVAVFDTLAQSGRKLP
jgi:tight adherence protein C